MLVIPLSGSSFETFGDDNLVVLGDEFILLVRVFDHGFRVGRILFLEPLLEECVLALLVCELLVG